MSSDDIRSLLDKITILSEADVPPATFTPNYYHKGNLGNTIPLMLDQNGKMWWERDGAIERWNGNVNNRSAINPASVDGEWIDGKAGPEWPTGTTLQQHLIQQRQQPATDNQSNGEGGAQTFPVSPPPRIDAIPLAPADRVNRFRELLQKAGAQL